MLSGIFGAIQREEAAYGAIACFIIGRSFGALWPPLLHYLFPSEHFGTIFGATIALSVCAKGTNILLFHYIVQWNSYYFASLLIGCLSSFILIFCLLVGQKANKDFQSRNNGELGPLLPEE